MLQASQQLGCDKENEEGAKNLIGPQVDSKNEHWTNKMHKYPLHFDIDYLRLANICIILGNLCEFSRVYVMLPSWGRYFPQEQWTHRCPSSLSSELFSMEKLVESLDIFIRCENQRKLLCNKALYFRPVSMDALWHRSWWAHGETQLQSDVMWLHPEF